MSLIEQLVDSNTTVAEPITREQFLAMTRKLLEQPYPPPHGSKDRPHLVHPRNRDWCIECGTYLGDRT